MTSLRHKGQSLYHKKTALKRRKSWNISWQMSQPDPEVQWMMSLKRAVKERTTKLKESKQRKWQIFWITYQEMIKICKQHWYQKWSIKRVKTLLTKSLWNLKSCKTAKKLSPEETAAFLSSANLSTNVLTKGITLFNKKWGHNPFASQKKVTAVREQILPINRFFFKW